MYKSFCFLFAAASLTAQMPMEFSESQKIAVQNSILAKVGGTTISMIDVKKKMDMLFHQHYAHLSHSNQALYQFYEKSWRHIVMEMIDNELIIADATDREIKLTDSEIREEMETRFGPHIITTLDKIGVTYDEAWKMVKNDLIVRRMSWWFVQSKAMQSVTPQDIRQAYSSYLDEHPPYTEFHYRIVSIRSENPGHVVEDIHQFLIQSGKSPESLSAKLQEIDPSIQVSTEYTASDQEISEAHKDALSPLAPGSYSSPSFQKSRADNKTVARIFYLIGKTDHPATPFQELSNSLREQLVQKALVKQSQTYVEKLRKHYGFDAAHLKESFPEDMHPFSLQ